jgi:hypothetical protein
MVRLRINYVIELRKNIAAFILLLMFSASASALDAKMRLENIKSLGLSVEIPTQFTPLSEKLAEIKYPSKRRPQVIYSNESGSVSFGISKLKKPELVGIDEIKDNILIAMKNLAPQASQIEAGGNKAWLITFTSKGLDADILNMQLYMLSDNNLIIATFNMTESNVNEYQSLGKKTLTSIKLNG